MEITDFLRVGIKDSKAGGIKKVKEKRVKETKARRTSLRNNLLDNKRNIGPLTPVTELKKGPIKLKEKLEIWKKEKKEKLAKARLLKLKEKPVFKFSTHPETMSIEVATTTIKGKRISKLLKKNNKDYQFAKPDHKFNFKAPPCSSMKHRTTTKKPQTSTKTDVPIVRVTRSKKQLFNSPFKELQPKKRTPKNTNVKKTTNKDIISNINPTQNNNSVKLNTVKTQTVGNVSTSKKLKSNAKIVEPIKKTKKKSLKKQTNILEGIEVIQVPEVIARQSEPINASMEIKSPNLPVGNVTPKNIEKPIAYVSPFVTLSRGKDKSRQEYAKRTSRGGVSEDMPESTGTSAGAAYFRNMLDIEICRINEMCDEWSRYREEQTPIEEACDMIHVAIGQSQLLITKRMQQFRGLIDNCEFQNSTPPITCIDLHGFWDLLLCQAENLNKRFDNLKRLKENNWEELAPEKKIRVAPPKKKKIAPPKKSIKATSSIRDAIKAAKKRAAQEKSGEMVTHSVLNSEYNSPSRSSVRKATPNKATKTPLGRKSLLQTVLSAQTNRRTTLSPCVAMMRVAKIGKQLNLSINDSVNTPSKSILKQTSKSTQKKGKSVLFIEHASDDKPTIEDDEENDFTQINSIDKSPDVIRRSCRLSRNKLF